jgi:hypothetical protein
MREKLTPVQQRRHAVDQRRRTFLVEKMHSESQPIANDSYESNRHDLVIVGGLNLHSSLILRVAALTTSVATTCDSMTLSLHPSPRG